MIYKQIMKFIFIIGIPVCWARLSIQPNNLIFLEFPTYEYTDLYQCNNDMIVLNFSKTGIIDISPDFISSPLITCLNLINRNIKDIANNSFRSLPNLTYLFLSNNSLNSSNEIYSFGDHEELNVLILNNVTDNKKSIIGNFGNYPNLEILLARNNTFYDLQSETFSDSDASPTRKIPFPKLKFLDLSENYIGYKGNIGFMKLLSNNLQFLDLHDNKLNSLFLYEKGSNLLALNIDNNYFQSVKYKANYNLSLELAYLKNLRYLSVSGNKIQAIDLNAFEDNDKLTYLNLSKNNISGLHPDTFANLHALQVLDLSFNQLDYILQISNQININVLNLSCNKIQRIISNTFIQTPKLTKLLLGGNQIYQIDAKAFAYLSVLEILDLSNNKFNSLPEGWTEFLVSLKYLDLSDNMFTLLESLSLTNALPLIEVYLVRNPLEYTNIRYAENLPQNLTVNLIQKSSFACKCIA
ncbi:leucine-rich repeat-containing protein 15-like [Linepithema humile]|uniref:leucine-rich repeat-containing protein 15-like n=1 Tax=Linepithema humile TaxID=83485 RepID=UPI0006237EF1|nr:PREDICTED: leucine-rich repeat-containing protein egg-6-like [Linepithema humile]